MSQFRLSRFFLVVHIAALLFVCKAKAQEFRLDFSKTPLAEALVEFREIAGADVVFSPELVAPYVTSCKYEGASPKNALICIVLGLPFQAREVGGSQFVLIPLSTDTGASNPAKLVLNGFVSDKLTGETLIGAHVLLPGIGAGTTTNDAGFLRFLDYRADQQKS